MSQNDTPIDIDFVKNLPIVWLTEDRKFAWLIQENAHFAVVAYSDGNTFYRSEIEHDEYVTWEERAIDYESE